MAATLTDTSIQVQMITHKGEIVFVFSQPITTWSFAPKQAREIAEQILKTAATLDAPAAKPN